MSLTTKTAEVAEQSKPSKSFVPSGNWAALQKTLTTQPSKKRKRSTPAASNSTATLAVTSPSGRGQSLTTYNPWNPNASNPGRKGNQALIQHTSTADNQKAGRYVGIDCEMVGAGADASEDVLARVSLVNFYGNVLLDIYVTPTARVTDWRTKYSGIRPSDVLNNPEAKPFNDVQKQVEELIKDRTLIGHALKSDFAVLKLTHPKEATRDTCHFDRFREAYGSGKAPSLKKIVQGELNLRIQVSEHDSVEDAQAAMALYRTVQEDWEKQFRIKRTKTDPQTKKKKVTKKGVKKEDTNA